jgi:hypothetical protein
MHRLLRSDGRDEPQHQDENASYKPQGAYGKRTQRWQTLYSAASYNWDAHNEPPQQKARFRRN